jgi:hypothetical protein
VIEILREVSLHTVLSVVIDRRVRDFVNFRADGGYDLGFEGFNLNLADVLRECRVTIVGALSCVYILANMPCHVY